MGRGGKVMREKRRKREGRREGRRERRGLG